MSATALLTRLEVVQEVVCKYLKSTPEIQWSHLSARVGASVWVNNGPLRASQNVFCIRAET